MVDFQETKERLEVLLDSYQENEELSEEEKMELLSIKKAIRQGSFESGLMGNSTLWGELQRIANALGSAASHKGRGL